MTANTLPAFVTGQAEPPEMPLFRRYRDLLLTSWFDEHSQIVPLEDLPALIDELTAALAPAAEGDVRKAAALITGGYPNGNPADPKIYVAMVLSTLSEYPTDAVWATTRAALRSLKFLPTVSELVEIAEGFVRDRRTADSRARQMVGMHADRERKEAEARARAEANKITAGHQRQAEEGRRQRAEKSRHSQIEQNALKQRTLAAAKAVGAIARSLDRSALDHRRWQRAVQRLREQGADRDEIEKLTLGMMNGDPGTIDRIRQLAAPNGDHV